MSCQTGIEASQELREFLGGCRGGCTRCVKVLISYVSCWCFWWSFGECGVIEGDLGRIHLAVKFLVMVKLLVMLGMCTALCRCR